MKSEIAKLHIKALPCTWSSKKGEKFVGFLYKLVHIIGFVKYGIREGRVVGVISGVGPVILTLVVDPQWQRKGVGRELLAKVKGRPYVYTQDNSVGFYEKMGFERIGQIGAIIILRKAA